MIEDDIFLWLSVIGIALVVLWAVLMIRAYDKVSKND